MDKTFSEMLIERGVTPNAKKYSKVTPKGIYKLFPSMWKTAKQLEQSTDFTYDILMNQYHLAESRYRLEQFRATQSDSKDKQ